jgi:hypothetical protein
MRSVGETRLVRNVNPLQRALCDDERPDFCHFVNMRTHFDLDADG